MEKLERDFYVFRLTREDKELLQSLGGSDQSRHEALLALIPIVKRLKLPKHETPERYPLRVGIPAELKEELLKVKKRTGQSLVDILLAAARESQPRRRPRR